MNAKVLATFVAIAVVVAIGAFVLLPDEGSDDGNVLTIEAEGTYEGDYERLVVSEKLGDGTATLRNMTIAGDVIVNGGGDHSLIIDSCDIGGSVIVNKEGVRIVSAGTTEIATLVANCDIILGSDGSGGFSSVISSGVRGIVVQPDASVGRMESDGGRIVSDGSIGTIVQVSGTLSVEGKGAVGTVHTKGHATVSSDTAGTIVCSTDSVDDITITGGGSVDVRVDGAGGASIGTTDGADVRLSTELEQGPTVTVDGTPVEVHRPVTVTIEGDGVTVMDGGREIQSGSKVGYGTVLAVAIADRTGYTGIVTASVGSVSGGTYAAVQDVAFAGTYTANTYSLTIRYTGAPSAVPDHTRTVVYGSAYSVESPAVTGYSPDTPVVSGTMPAEDLVVEVSYSVQTYKLTVRYAGAPSPVADHVSDVAYGTRYSVPSPSVSGYSPDRRIVSGTMPAEDVVITVGYTANAPYVPPAVRQDAVVTIAGEGVSVKAGGRDLSSGSRVPIGTVLAVAIADRTGHTGTVAASVGSISEGSYAVSRDVTFTGTYTVNEYALTVRYTGAPSSIDDYTSRVQYGATYSVESPTVSGYMPNRATVSGTMPASDLIVDVVYAVAKHTITWKDCDGAVINATLVEYGSMPSHADPVRTGDDAVYVFESWTPALSVATADVEYTAVYKEYRHFTISQSGSVINGGEYWNVTVSESVGDGNVTLEGVSIHGKLIVRGGGSNSIVLNGCSVGEIESSKDGVRIVAKGSAVPVLKATASIILGAESNGSFGKVEAKQGITIQSGAKVGTLDATGDAVIDGKVERHIQRDGTIEGGGASTQVVAYGTVTVSSSITSSILCPEDSTNVKVKVTGDETSVSVEVNCSGAEITGVILNNVYTSSGGAINVTVNGSQESVKESYIVAVSGGKVHKKGDSAGAASAIRVEPNTVVTVAYETVGGKTFSMWTDHMGDRIPGSGENHSFDLLVRCDTYISAHYMDESQASSSADIITVKEKKYCHETGICYVLMPDGSRYYCSVPATEHIFDDTDVTTPPTCVEEGAGTNTCSICGYSESVSIPANGHDYGEWSVTVGDNGQAEKVRTCSQCPAEDRISIVVPNGNIRIDLDMPGLAKETHYIFDHEGKKAYLYSVHLHADSHNDAGSYFLWIDSGPHSPVFVLRTFNHYYVYGNDSPWGICGYADSYADYVRFISDSRIGADNGRTNTSLYDLFFMYGDELNERGDAWFDSGTSTLEICGRTCTAYKSYDGHDFYWVDEDGCTLMYRHHNGTSYTITYRIESIAASGSYSDFVMSEGYRLPAVPSAESISQYRVDVTGGSYRFESSERAGYYNVTTVDSFGGIRPVFPDGATSVGLEVRDLDGKWVRVQSWTHAAEDEFYIPVKSTGENHTIRTLFEELASSDSGRFVEIGAPGFSDIGFRCVFGDTSKECSITIVDGYYVDPVIGENKTLGKVPAGLVVKVHADDKFGMTHRGWKVVKNGVETVIDTSGTLELLAEEGSVTVSPRFAIDDYLIHLRSTAGGSLTGGYVFGDGTKDTIDGGINLMLGKGTHLAVTAVPDAGYRFVGWYWINGASPNGLYYPQAGGYAIYGNGPDTGGQLSFDVDRNITYTAVFEPMTASGNKVFITSGFVYDDGHGIRVSSIYADGKVSLTTDPGIITRTYHTWSIYAYPKSDVDPVLKTLDIVPGMDCRYEPSCDVTIAPVFEDEISRCILKFNGNGGGDVVTGVPSQISRSGEGRVVLPSESPVRAGYVFLGWSADESETNEQECLKPGAQYTLTSEATTLHAIWYEYFSVISFRVDPFGDCDGYSFKTGVATYRQPYRIDDDHFAGPGFDVIKWKDSEGNIYSKDGNRTVHCKGNGDAIELKAIYESIEFWTISIEFHSNIPDSDTVEVKSLKYEGKNKCSVDKIKPTPSVRDGYTFVGWSKTSTGEPSESPTFDLKSMIDPGNGGEPLKKDEHLHLYAIWSPVTS